MKKKIDRHHIWNTEKSKKKLESLIWENAKELSGKGNFWKKKKDLQIKKTRNPCWKQ